MRANNGDNAEYEFRFEVPATCANLGPGFGALGLALQIPLQIEVRSRKETGHVVIHEGEDGSAPTDPRHDRILRALESAAERFAIPLPKGLEIHATNKIPAATGLGTVSAGFAAGIGVAIRYAKESPGADELTDLLVELGGDASHGGAALYGGLVAACPVQLTKKKVTHRVFRYPFHDDWQLAVVCPKVRLATAEVRRVLPAALPHAVIRRTSGRLLGLLHALAEGDEELLRQCIVDEVHVPFRRRLLRGLDEAMRAGTETGAAVTISGAGPSLIALSRDPKRLELVQSAMAKPLVGAGYDVDAFAVRFCAHGALHSPLQTQPTGTETDSDDEGETT